MNRAAGAAPLYGGEDESQEMTWDEFDAIQTDLFGDNNDSTPAGESFHEAEASAELVLVLSPANISSDALCCSSCGVRPACSILTVLGNTEPRHSCFICLQEDYTGFPLSPFVSGTQISIIRSGDIFYQPAVVVAHLPTIGPHTYDILYEDTSDQEVVDLSEHRFCMSGERNTELPDSELLVTISESCEIPMNALDDIVNPNLLYARQQIADTMVLQQKFPLTSPETVLAVYQGMGKDMIVAELVLSDFHVHVMEENDIALSFRTNTPAASAAKAGSKAAAPTTTLGGNSKKKMEMPPLSMQVSDLCCSTFHI